MKTLKHWLPAVATITLALGFAACNQNSNATESRAGGATSGSTPVSEAIFGSYVVDMAEFDEALGLREEGFYEGMSESDREMAESMMMMLEGMATMFGGLTLELRADSTFEMGDGGPDIVEGEWTLEGDQITIAPSRVKIDGEWEPATGVHALKMIGTWDESEGTINMRAEGQELDGLIFRKVMEDATDTE